MTERTDVVVVGAGVIGLTAAVVLAEQGRSVRVVAEDIPGTASLAAGALWGPYHAEPVDRVHGWASRSLTIFSELAAADVPGVQMVYGVEASRQPAFAGPDFVDLLPDVHAVDAAELPAGFASGIGYTAPLIDMPKYLDYLLHRLGSAGGQIEHRRLRRLDETFGLAPTIVNCSGMGAAYLVPDEQLTPIRGQLVVAENPGIDSWFSEDTGASPDLLHWYPHEETIVLGGQAAPGTWDTAPSPKTSAAILARCAEVEPRLRNARILEHRAGLRPTRPSIRLDAEQRAASSIIHCYGHGGAGVTVSWGCARDLATMA